MTMFDHQRKESAGSAPLRNPSALLPVETPQSAATALVNLVPKAVKGGTADQMNATLDILKGLYDAWQLPQVAKLYAQKTGRSLLNDLLDVFEPWIDVRRDVAKILQGLIPNLTWHAFLEQIAYGIAYAQRDDMEDAKGGGDDTNMRQVLKAAGFQAGPLIRGRWGLQFRTFRPLPGAFKQMPIVTFRGTEGVQMPWTDPMGEKREGMVDTWIGDMTRMGAGYPQYAMNASLIQRNMAGLGQSAVTGHSLGGGLAQIVMAKLPDLVSECVTFNAPGINNEDAKALEKENIATTHHRTLRDVVPSGNSKAAPGTILTYERLIPPAAGTGWSREPNLLNPHNHMPINGLLNYEDEGNLTPLQMTMRKSGANGPAAADQQDRSISALMSVRSTRQDPVMHGGEVGPDDGATYKTFRANLGYNLLVEYAQSSIAKMDPEKLTLAQVDKQLNTLGRTLTDLSVLPITKDVMDLFQGMGLRTWENYKSIGGNVQKTEQGAPIKLSQEDRTAVVVQLRQMWQAWWPEAKR